MAEFGENSHAIDSKPLRDQSSRLPFDRTSHSTSKTLWTSARCNRLLRPLSSKIALLRKEILSQSQRSERDLEDTANSGLPEVTAAAKILGGGGQCLGVGFAPGASREWESNPRPRKRMKRTYSSKEKSFATGADREKTISRPNHRPHTCSIDLPPQLSLELQQAEGPPPFTDGDLLPYSSHMNSTLTPVVSKLLAPHNWKLVDGICKGLVALLKATAGNKSLRTQGCRSLLSSCLRQTPQYIAEEDALIKATDPDNETDMSNTVYNELEEFGSIPGNGWEPLRILVRAHGIKMISDGIEEGLLGTHMARFLAQICLCEFAYDEAQSIVQSLSRFLKLSESVSCYPLLISSCLADIVASSGRSGFLYRHIAAMLNDQVFTPDWISHRSMIGTWNGVIRSITAGDEDAQSASLLLRSALGALHMKATDPSIQEIEDMRLRLYQASHRPNLRSAKHDQSVEGLSVMQSNHAAAGKLSRKASADGATSTLSDVLTVLCAVACLQDSAAPDSSDDRKLWILTVLQDLALEARQAIELVSIKPESSSSIYTCADSIYLPLVAAGLAELWSSRSNNSQQDLTTVSVLIELSDNHEIFKVAGPFICAVVRCKGRTRSEDAFSAVKTIVQELTELSTSQWPNRGLRKLCNDLAIATAFAHAEETGRPMHLEWALELESMLIGKGISTPKPATMRTPVRGKTQTKCGFRWEEGICEWIARTPDVLMQKPIEVDPHGDTLDKTSPSLGNGMKHVMPLATECWGDITEKSMFQEVGQSSNLSGLRVVVPLADASFRSHGTLLGSSSTFQSPKNRAPSKVESSHEKSPVLSTLAGPPNAVLGQKRKRISEQLDTLEAAYRKLVDPVKVPAQEDHRDSDMSDVDELAF